MTLRRQLSWLIPLAAAAASVTCGGDGLVLPPEGVPVAILIVQGNGQTGVVGQQLTNPVVVKVVDSKSRAVTDQKIRFVLTGAAAGADVIPDTAITDDSGQASTAWTLGTTAGAQGLQARVVATGAAGQLTKDFTATAVANQPDTVFVIKGQSQTGTVGTILTDSLIVKLTDRFGNGISGVDVAWAAIGGGTVSATTVTTGPTGQSAVQRVLGPTAGPQSATATVSLASIKGSPVTFSHTAVPGGASTLNKVFGDAQFGLVGLRLTDSLVVEVLDANHNGVPGRNVSWVAPPGSGSVAPTSSLTDASGKAFTIWTLGTSAGSNTVTAAAANLPQVSFTATGTAAQPTKLVATSPTTLTGTAGLPVTQVPSAKVTDANNNPVQGVTVTFTVTAGGGSVSDGTASGPSAQVATNAGGIAALISWTLGTVAGPNTLSVGANNAGGSPLTGSPIGFSATGNPGPAALLALITSPPATLTNGSTISPAPVVQLEDANGNVVAQGGISVTVSLVGSGATLGGTKTLNTNSSGQVTFSNLTLTGLVGSYNLSFTSGVLAGVSSGAITLTPGAATKLTLTTQPSATAQSGAPFAQQPVVQVVDASGNAVAQPATLVTVVIASGGGSLGGTLTQATDIFGAATFTDLSISGAPGGRTLNFSAAGTGLTSVTSTTVTLGAGTATKLALTTQPSATVVNGAVLTRQPVVQLEDGTGNPVAQANVNVTATLSAGASLGGTATVATDNAGVATFSGLSLTGLVGSYTLTFSSGSLTPITSNSITLSAGQATDIGISAGNNQSAPAGQAVSVDPAAIVTDQSGNPVGGIGVSFAAAPGSGTVSPTTPIPTNSSGIATVNSWTLGPAAGPNALSATANGLNGSPLAFTATGLVGTATKLTITTQPSATAQSGLSLPQQPVVQVQDAAGNGVAQSGITVTATFLAGTGSLTNATATTDGAGNATFSGLTISGLAGSYQLTFGAGGLTSANSNVIALTAGLAFKLGMNRQPSSTAQSGVAFATQPRLQLQDSAGNSVNLGSVTITATFATGSGTLTNATATTSSAGLATFSGLAISGLVGSYSLQFDATSLAGILPVTSISITLSAGPASQASIVVQPPANASSGVAFTTAPVVQLLDGAGNTVSQAGIALTATPSGGSLTNATASTQANGAATFTGLTLTGSPGAYTLSFGNSALGLTPDVSNPITLGSGGATKLSITTPPSASVVNGQLFPVQPEIQLRDASNNAVSQAGVNVNVLIQTGSGTLGGTTTVQTDAGGLASFTDLVINGVTGNRTLIFTAASGACCSSVTSGTISVAVGAPASVTIQTQPSSSAQNTVAFATQPVVLVKDAGGFNAVPFTSVNASIATGGGSLTGGISATTNGSGVASFSGLTITGATGAHTLQLTAGSAFATSTSINLTPGPANAAQSSATVPDGVAGQPTTITVQAADVSGNQLTTGGATVVVTISGGNSATPAVSDNGNGTYTASYAPAVAGTDQVAITLNGGTIGGSPYTSTVVTGAVSAANSSVQVSNPGITASSGSSSTTITVTARDGSNNPIPSATVVLASTGIGNALTQPGSTTNSSGVATGSMSSTKAESKTISATVNGVTITQKPTVTVSAAAANAGQTTATVSASVQAGSTSGIVVQVRDQFGNPETSGGDAIVVSVSGANSANPAVSDNNNGTYTASYNPTVAGGDNVAITLTGAAIGGSPYASTITPGAASQLVFTVQPSNTAVLNTITPPVLVEIQDNFGNLVTSATNQVTVAIGNDPVGSSSLTGTTSQNASGGVATFGDLSIGPSAGNGFTLTAGAGGFPTVESNPFDIQ